MLNKFEADAAVLGMALGFIVMMFTILTCGCVGRSGIRKKHIFYQFLGTLAASTTLGLMFYNLRLGKILAISMGATIFIIHLFLWFIDRSIERKPIDSKNKAENEYWLMKQSRMTKLQKEKK